MRPRAFTYRAIRISALLLTCLQVGCGAAKSTKTSQNIDGGAGANEGGADPRPSAVSKPLGNAGGTIAVKGVSLVVPAGALDHDVELTIKVTASSDQLDVTPVSSVFSFEPSGLQFAIPATVVFDHDEADDEVVIAWSKPGKAEFLSLPTMSSHKTARAYIKHFSLGVLTRGKQVKNGDAIAVTVGTGFACALMSTHQVVCWGMSELFPWACQDGGSSCDELTKPTVVMAFDAAQEVAAGAEHLCVLEWGVVYCWGANDQGQLGYPCEESQERCFSGVPTAVRGLALGSTIVDISANDFDTCILTGLGEVQCWGSAYGPEPVYVKKAGVIHGRRLATGSRYDGRPQGCVIADGQVACWGEDLSTVTDEATAFWTTEDQKSATTSCAFRTKADLLGDLADSSSIEIVEESALDRCDVNRANECLPRAFSGATNVGVGERGGCVNTGEEHGFAVTCWGWLASAPHGGPLPLEAGCGTLGAFWLDKIYGSTLAVATSGACVSDGRQIWCWGANEGGIAGACLQHMDDSDNCLYPSVVAGVTDDSYVTRVGDIGQLMALQEDQACAVGVFGSGTVGCWGTGAAETLGIAQEDGDFAPLEVSNGSCAGDCGLGFEFGEVWTELARNNGTPKRVR